VTRWPLGEALAAYEARLAEKARQQYMVEFLAWNIRTAAGSREKPPPVPAILRAGA
jgi:hypothetical protein